MWAMMVEALSRQVRHSNHADVLAPSLAVETREHDAAQGHLREVMERPSSAISAPCMSSGTGCLQTTRAGRDFVRFPSCKRHRNWNVSFLRSCVGLPTERCCLMSALVMTANGPSPIFSITTNSYVLVGEHRHSPLPFCRFGAENQLEAEVGR